jgi:phosphatidylglycerol---prolipoprotein diacylglyceryl transferase
MCAPSIAIGYAFTRIGCFLNGCCYGSPSDLPWACKFNENSILTPPSHPTQIYASIINIIIFVVLIKLEKLNKWKGFVFTSYIAMYGIYRFLIEFLRSGYSADMTVLGITQAQVVSLIMIITALIIIKKKG